MAAKPVRATPFIVQEEHDSPVSLATIVTVISVPTLAVQPDIVDDVVAVSYTNLTLPTIYYV